MPYTLVIFDFDGTLADSAAWFLARFNGVADRYRFPKLSPEEVEEMRGLNSREIVRRLSLPVWKLPLIARHVRQLAIDDPSGIALFPGIETMLRDLDQRGAQIAVVSSNAEETIRRTMGASLAASIDHFECGASLFGKARRLRVCSSRAASRPRTRFSSATRPAMSRPRIRRAWRRRASSGAMPSRQLSLASPD